VVGVPVGSAMKPVYSAARAGSRAVYSAAQVYCPSAVSVVGCRAYLASPAGSTAVLHWVADYYRVDDYFPAVDY
jgi:hypothetical protein